MQITYVGISDTNKFLSYFCPLYNVIIEKEKYIFLLSSVKNNISILLKLFVYLNCIFQNMLISYYLLIFVMKMDLIFALHIKQLDVYKNVLLYF